MNICDQSLCTGCEACRNACPKQCINMVENVEGFLFPIIDNKRCIKCKKCQNACPVMISPKFNRQSLLHTYACWHTEKSIRQKSTSGGAFTALAEAVLEKGGVVYGAAYDQQMHVRHKGINDPLALDDLRRSKYVQSEIGLVYIDVKNNLQNGNLVLFVGTPCQVAGLHTFLGKVYENLLSCDFICHGVPSPKVFKMYIDWLERCLGFNVVDMDFRDKRKGWENFVTVARLSNGKNVILNGKKNSYYDGFVQGVFLRESCYVCQFNGLKKISDLTLADFWGIGRRIPFTCEKQKRLGISMVLGNSCKGNDFLHECDEKLGLVVRSIQEVIENNSHLQTPATRPLSRDLFGQSVVSDDYVALAGKCIRLSYEKRMKNLLKYLLSGRVLRILRNMYGKIR